MNHETNANAKKCSKLPFVRKFKNSSVSPPRSLAAIAACLFVMLIAAACASTKVTDREQFVNGQIARPAHIWVYDFVATHGDLPPDSRLAGEKALDTTPQTPEQIATGKELGSAIATELVSEIRAMGMTASEATPKSVPQVNDLVIRGYLLSIQQGSATKRVLIGFGSGGAELRTMVEGFQVTPQGQRELGTGTEDAGGGKSPGEAMGVATFLATKNPAGLIVGGGMKAYGEESGESTVKGRAQATAKEIGVELKKRFHAMGWID